MLINLNLTFNLFFWHGYSKYLNVPVFCSMIYLFFVVLNFWNEKEIDATKILFYLSSYGAMIEMLPMNYSVLFIQI